MNFSDFFIRRPLFAVVLSVLIVIGGGLAFFRLPLTEYPQVTPTTIVVRANYPGSDPEVLAETVAAPLEQAINGVEDMLYMSSQAATDGRLTVTVTFAQGADPDLAQINVQNRVARALARLPGEVQALGVVTAKTSPDMLMVIHLVSPDERYDALHLVNFAMLNVRDELARLPGVNDVIVWGAGEYSLRVWLDPTRLAGRQLTANDVIHAIREQNVQVAAGTLGQPPTSGAAFQFTVKAPGRLGTVEEFADVVIKSGAHGELTRLRDVARVELGADSYGLRSFLNNQQAAGIQVIQKPGTSALEVAKKVRERMAELERSFPEGISHRIAYDPTIFVRASLRSVFTTLAEAVALVVIVVMLFLQTWRASFIPLAAVPVSLVGTFAVMHAFGFSLNTLSLFGLVLSIGIVVDDAIVVVENVERHLAKGISAMEAARAAMREVTGPIIAITSVLVAVFVPTALLGGLTGQFYQQFALTIAISTIISAINSLTLSPALAARLLRPHGENRMVNAMFGWLFRPFNRFFERASLGYLGIVRRTIRFGTIAGVIYLGLGALTYLGLSRTPAGFVPAQDKYYLVGIAHLPDAASLDRTEAVVRRMTDILLAEPGVENVVAFPGLSISGFASLPNAAVVFATLDPFDQRRTPDLSAAAIAGRVNQKFAAIEEGITAVFPPPPVPGLGAIGGFKLQIEDRAGAGYEALFAATQKLIAEASKRPELAGLFSSFQVNVPQIHLDVDRDRVKAHGLALGDVHAALQANLGSLYVNDVNFFGRIYRVFVQADASFRSDESALQHLKVRNHDGALVPLTSVVKVNPTTGPDRVIRYNGYASADINGNAAPGTSSGQAQALMEQLAKEVLPDGFAFEWTDLAYQQKLAGKSGAWIFVLCVLLAYLILAAQYNSWTLPLAAILIVPLTLLSALMGVWLTGGDNNLFTQIGLVVLVGLAAKNAILIVEFARSRESQGAEPLAAALEACQLRLRPILMTSLAFIMGVLPLVFASGAGAEMRQAMGVAVFAGMLGVTVFGLIFTPLFYVALRKLGRRARTAAQPQLNPIQPSSMAMNKLTLLSTLAAGALLSGCAVGPKYNMPITTAAPTFGESNTNWFAAGAPEIRWWALFNDSTLNGLIERAATNNHDLSIADARLDEARALRRGALWAFAPQGGPSAGFERANLGFPGGAGSTWSSGFDATWEIDVFGRLRRGAEAAAAEAGAAEAELRNVQVALLAEVAANYFGLRGAQEGKVLLEQQRALLQRSLKTTQTRVAAGRGSQLDAARAEALLRETEAAVPLREREEREHLHRLAVLLGEQPRSFVVTTASNAAPSAGREIAIGTPAELLRRRPDVAAAERHLAAATAIVGMRTAEMFPEVSVSGFIRFLGGDRGSVGATANQVWSVGPQATWHLLSLGRLNANRRASQFRAEGALAAYDRTVLQALEDVANALVRYRAAEERLASLGQRQTAAERALRLAQAQYEAGAIGALEAIDAERTALTAARETVSAATEHRLAVVALNKALGGGWEDQSLFPRK